jgi:hypothetical protein
MGMLSATPRPLYPSCTQPLVPLYKRLGGPRGRSEWVRKMSPPPGFEPRTVHPVTSRYTDYAVIQYVPAGLRANDSLPFNAQVMNAWNHTCMPPCFHGTCLPSKGYRQCPVLVTRCIGLFNTGWGDRKWTQEMSTAVEVPLHIRPVSKHKIWVELYFHLSLKF